MVNSFLGPIITSIVLLEFINLAVECQPAVADP
jgi:hypothetical protein